MQKIIRIISIVLLEVILLLSAGLLGMQNERERISQEEQAETVTDIAIVNLDKGIREGDTTKYYSNELMSLELDDLVADNLEAARQGIYNGSYAAYIIIPAEFSENAVSLNDVPTKSTLEFAVNPNLREDVSRLTMANIKNFEINLNTNMSYMYVQAILEEFHAVQDSTGIIMQNDSDELARIMGIDPEGLMKSPEPFEIEWANPDIEDVDFEGVYETNTQISEDLRDNYDHFVTQGKEAFEVIREGEGAVVDGMDSFFAAMLETDIETDSEGNVVYEQGLNELSLYIEEYDREFTQQKNKVFEMIDAAVFITPTPTPTGEPSGTPTAAPAEEPSGTPTASPVETPDSTPTGEPAATQEPEPTASATPEIIPIPVIIKNTLDSSLEKANSQIKERNINTEQQINEVKGIIGEIRILLGEQTEMSTYEEPAEEAGTEAQETDHDYELPDEEISGRGGDSEDVEQQILDYLNKAEMALDEIALMDAMTIEEIYNEEALQKEFRKLAEEIQSLPELDIDEYTGMFETGVLEPLKEEITNENTRIQEAGSTYMEIQSRYIEELGLFDPYDYYDYEKMNELTVSFEENIYELEEKVYESRNGYLELIYDTVDTSNESMETMQENLEDAYAGTESNVQQEIDLAKQYRESINETNVDILGDFKEKLPYTRIGNLEYVQAYDFMVKPIRMWDNSVTKNRVSIWQDTEVLRNILIILIVIWGISVCTLLVIRVHADAGDDFDSE